jgi:hypothetical protein
LCVLTLPFLNLADLIVVWCSKLLKPGLRIGIYALDVSIRAGLFGARYPIVGWFAPAAIFDGDGIEDVLSFTTLGCGSGRNFV